MRRRRRLRHIILSILSSKGAMTGAQIMREIERVTQGFWKPSPGAIYPTLDKLLEEGYVVISKVDGAQKFYEITELGREFLSPKHQLETIIEEVVSDLRFIMENKDELDQELKDKLKKVLQEVMSSLDRS
ncbi:PadR family transcriptional regulator [Stygiolobus caldivivus]|nr:PadR family transcriptional regulator [Stygiolobus caldivivus]